MKKIAVVMTWLLGLAASGAQAENFEQQARQISRQISDAVLQARQASGENGLSRLREVVTSLPPDAANFEKIKLALAELGVRLAPDADFEDTAYQLMAQMKPERAGKVRAAFAKAGLPEAPAVRQTTYRRLREINGVTAAFDKMQDETANRRANLPKMNAVLGALGLRPGADFESSARKLLARIQRAESLEAILAVKAAFVKSGIEVSVAAPTALVLRKEKEEMIHDLGHLLADHAGQKKNYGKLARALASLGVKPASSFMAALAQLQHLVQNASTAEEIEGLSEVICDMNVYSNEPF